MSVDLAAAVEQAASMLGARARAHVPLAPFTTYRLGGPARLFVEANGGDDLLAVGRVVAATGLPVLVVGRGSNLLVADRGFDGLALHLGAAFATVAADDVEVRAGGAVTLPVLARKSVAAGLAGFEWGVGVPGSVGGAVRMNAGGHGSDVATTLVGVRVVDLATGDDGVVAAADLDLRFRGSNVSSTQVVTEATFRLTPGDRGRGEAELAEIVRWRREHQPGGQNCGSVFKNPLPDSAGRLVEMAGCKGLRVGSAYVSDKHANFFQADEAGSGDDVLELIRLVRSRVLATMGVDLRTEVRLVGFPDGAELEAP